MQSLKIADELVRRNRMSIDRATLSFVDFKDELPCFIEGVPLPLMRQASLRDGRRHEGPYCRHRRLLYTLSTVRV